MKVSDVLQTIKGEWVAVLVNGMKIVDAYGFPGNKPALWHITDNRKNYPEYADREVWKISIEHGPYGPYILIHAR